MYRKVINILFFLISFSLIFNNIPKVLQMNFVGGGILGNKLVFYPLFIGLVYTIYCQYKYKNVLVKFDKFVKFIFAYLAITLISLIIGLYNYPYYDLVMNGPVTQIEKLPKVMAILDNFGINIDQKVLIAFWMVARVVKGLLFEIIYTFCGAYMIYCWYHDDWKIAFKILLKAILLSLIIVFAYSFIEIFYLAGNITAKDILIKITPYFHEINNPASSRGDWPPVLWYSPQLRSIFAEPSYFAIFAGFSVPFIWYCINVKTQKILYSVLLCFMAFFIFLTQARTATALLFGEIILLLLLSIYFRNKLIVRTLICVLLSTGIAFISANYFINNFMKDVPKYYKQSNITLTNTQSKSNYGKELKSNVKDKKINKIQKSQNLINQKQNSKNLKLNNKTGNYLDKNFYSIFSANKRSNSARFAYIKSAFRVGLDYPILGVGKGLTAAYMTDYFTDDEKKVGEVKRRIQRQKDVGILTAGMPILCEYVQRFAESGLAGVIIYFMPLIYLIYSIFRKIKTLQPEYLFYGVSFIGILASGFSLGFTGTYYYWVLLGLGYAMCFGKDAEEKF